MKHIETIIKSLPSDVAALAIERTIQNENTKFLFEDTDSGIQSVLMRAFVWDETPEGSRFWLDVYDNSTYQDEEQDKPKKKTYREVLGQLPEPYATLAIENMENLEGAVRMDEMSPSLDPFESLNYAFTWRETPQGYEFWSVLVNRKS